MNSFIQEAKMNETWLHSSPPGFQPLHSATHQFTIQLTVPMEIGTWAFSLAPWAEAQWDSSDGTVHTGSGEEKVPSTTGLALAGLLQTVKNWAWGRSKMNSLEQCLSLIPAHNWAQGDHFKRSELVWTGKEHCKPIKPYRWNTEAH